MPIDASIYSQIELPSQRQGRQAQLSSLMRQNELGDIQLENARTANADDSALRKLTMQSGGDTAKLRELLTQGGYHKQIQALDKADLDKQKVTADIAKTGAETQKLTAEGVLKKLEADRDSLVSVRTPEQFAAWRDGLVASWGPEVAKKVPTSYDPAWQRTAIMSADKTIEDSWKQQGFKQEGQKIAETGRHNRASEGISGGNLNLARDRLAYDKEQPKGVYDAARGVMVDPRSGEAKAVTMGGAPLAAKAGRPLSATAQKELIETEESLQGGKAALDLLKQAKDLNDKAMGFSGAGALASAGTLLPEAIRPESIDATQNLDNILQSSALPQLKAIFGGMPTEGERKILLDVQGSSSKPPKVRAEIFKRAESAINARLKFSSEKAQRLRDGSYFSGEGMASTSVDQQAPGRTVVRTGTKNGKKVVQYSDGTIEEQ